MNSKVVWLIAGLATIAAIAIGAVAILLWTTGDGLGILGGGTVLSTEKLSRAVNEYVLRPGDFSVNYYVKPNGEKILGNRAVILEMGQLDGKAYIVETGRVDGWYINLRRSNNTDIGPATYTNSIEIFETIDGARLALSPQYFKAYTDDNYDFEILDKNCNVGDRCITYTSEKFDPVTRLTTVRYDIGFVYRNVLVWISVTGLDVEVREADVLEAAQIILDKLAGFENN